MLRTADLTEPQREVCLRGIVQMAMADGVLEPRERKYLQMFVDEFFEGADPMSEELAVPLTDEDLETLDDETSRQSFVAYLYITAYIDEDFSEEEKKLADELSSKVVDEKRRELIVKEVREFLYRRSVFAFAFRFGGLTDEFARSAAERFHVDEETAVEINTQVFNAVMAMKSPYAQASAAEEATEA
jgi:uncharacterized membrane protein YebE (DUF533 family)